MKLTVGCTMRYQVAAPSAAFTFNVLALEDAQQRVTAETIGTAPDRTAEVVQLEKGGRALRCRADAGPFELRYAATVDVVRAALPEKLPAPPPGDLPLPILTYLLPSRYCESDRFGPMAWDLAGKIGDPAEQVRAICAWLDAKLEYAPGATDSRTSAWDVWLSRRGVCRDYTHLAIALCRALNIPARYVGGYAAGLAPMDFHACFEAYLGGAWQLFDPTDAIAPENIVVMARGRDAASAPLTTIFGQVSAGPVAVTCAVVP